LNIIFSLIVALFLLDELTSFDIKNQNLKSLIYYGFLIGAPLCLIGNAILIRHIKWKIIAEILPVAGLILILATGPIKIVFASAAWQTQTIMYQHGHLSSKKVEFQIQSVGAHGWNKRTVEVYYLTPLLMITGKVPDDIDKNVEWTRVNQDINEAGLK
jgi:small-conductance mechanosensitive channel